MRKAGAGICVLVVCLLMACSVIGVEPTSAPVIASMKIGIDDRSDALYSTRPTIEVYTAFLLELAEPSRYSSISNLKIQSPSGGTWAYDATELASYWETDRNRFAFWNRYSSSRPDYVDLGTYTVTISEEGKTDSVFTMDAYADNDPALNTGRLYSKSSSESPKILTIPSTATAVRSGDTLTISATGVAESMYGVFIWCYEGDTYLGGYNVAWPFTADQKPDFSIDQVLSTATASADSIIVGFLAETPLPETNKQMLYRYLKRIVP